MKHKFIPGDFVRTKSRNVHDFVITNRIGHVDSTNKHIGNLERKQVAIVISHSDEADETLIMTSSGILGWISTDSLVWVSDGRRVDRR